MSKIKSLKTAPENTFNLIEFIELFSPDKKSKYTDTLLRLMKSTPNLEEHSREIVKEITGKFDFISKEDLINFSPIQLQLFYQFIESYFQPDDLIKFRQFCEYNERNLIQQNDLSKYKSFDEIIDQLSLAELKVDSKKLENETINIYEDDEWLLIRPLTYLASKKYGSNTKWCTTSENNSEYFIKYSSRGVLIYCINKKNGYKVASFYSLDKNEKEFSYWNQKDTRIDSTESELTIELIKFIRDYVKDPKVKTNRFMLSDDQRKIEDKLLKLPSFKSGSFDVTEPIEEPQQLERPLSNRIEAAIRRESEELEVSESENDVVASESIIERMQLLTSNRQNG